MKSVTLNLDSLLTRRAQDQAVWTERILALSKNDAFQNAASILPGTRVHDPKLLAFPLGNFQASSAMMLGKSYSCS